MDFSNQFPPFLLLISPAKGYNVSSLWLWAKGKEGEGHEKRGRSFVPHNSHE
jgi:hypothetical protein